MAQARVPPRRCAGWTRTHRRRVLPGRPAVPAQPPDRRTWRPAVRLAAGRPGAAGLLRGDQEPADVLVVVGAVGWPCQGEGFGEDLPGGLLSRNLDRRGPADMWMRSAWSRSAKWNGARTSRATAGVSPAALASPSSLPGALRAKGPAAPAGAGGSSVATAARTARVSRPQEPAAGYAPAAASVGSCTSTNSPSMVISTSSPTTSRPSRMKVDPTPKSFRLSVPRAP